MTKATSRHPLKTYELRIILTKPTRGMSDLKERLTAWLRGQGVDSFVEGSIDNVDIDNEPGGPERDFYGELGGVGQPISVFKYSLEALEDLRHKGDREFAGEIVTEMHSMDTEVWMEGWKESFKPIITKRFYVYPPWDKSPMPAGLIPVEIEPGMAFGTGQHATTQLCLRGIEELATAAGRDFERWRVLDVGTGTGILAVGARKLGAAQLRGTDIDPDALIAARANAAVNKIDDVVFEHGSVPAGAQAELVIANILTWVLKKLMKDLAGAVAPGGRLLLSGLLVEDIDELERCAGDEGLRLVNRHTLDGGGALVFDKGGAKA